MRAAAPLPLGITGPRPTVTEGDARANTEHRNLGVQQASNPDPAPYKAATLGDGTQGCSKAIGMQ
ncbi:hypothetical protein GCM10009582_02290 [Arthrobacter flavus]